MLDNAVLPLLLYLPVLIYVMISDVRRMRIPNWTSVAGLALFVAMIPVLGAYESILRIFAAVAVFVVGFGLYSARMLAGGDVKIMAALMLFVPTGSLVLFAYVFSMSMLVGIVAISLCRKTRLRQTTAWVSLQDAGQMPMGLSIGLAGVVLAGTLLS